MKSMWLGLIACIGLFGCHEPETPWESACRLLEDMYSCEGLTEPVVTDLISDRLKGRYLGGDTIQINVELTGWERNAVIFHEIIHFLQVHVGDLNTPDYSWKICRAEEEAFRTTDIYIEHVLERPKEDLRGDDWWKPYRYCWEWYGPEGYRDIIIFEVGGLL